MRCIYIFILAFVLTSCANKGIELYDLRCNQKCAPNGVENPLLSWKIRTEEYGVSQEAWEVEVATSVKKLKAGKADVWRSGKKHSDKQFDIAPKEVQFTDASMYFWRVRIWDNNGCKSSWSDPAYFSTGLTNFKSWKAKWMTYTDNQTLPLFRKLFKLDDAGKKPKKAFVYMSSLGIGELYMNGKKVDDTRLLDPAQTNYDQFAFYSTYDVTEYLQSEKNCIGVMLGNGWFTQQKAWGGANLSYGKPMLLLQLEVIYDDNSRTIITSDEKWEYTNGPVCKANIYLGEEYDARKEKENWSTIDGDDKWWKQAVLAQNNIPPRVKAQPINPMRSKNVLDAVKMWQTASGSWVYDFGENIAGIPLLCASQPVGTKLTIRPSEEINADRSPDFTTYGWKYHGTMFEYAYTCKGTEKETWHPRFSYHGFRYAELVGCINKPDLSTLKLMVVHSDVEQRGYFECSNAQINKLHEIANRTVLSNLHGFPTDCPNREKCGWLGDTHAYAKMANLNFQMNDFWSKFLEDIRSGAVYEEPKTLFHERYNTTFYFTRKAAGIPYMIAPGKRKCGVASPAWGTALVQLPWWQYVYYGNKKVLEAFYSDMKLWVDYVSSLASDTARTNKYGAKTKYIVYQGLGDWCPPKYELEGETPVEFTSTAFHYLDVSIMEKVARILSKQKDVEKYTELKKAIAAELVEHLYVADQKTFGSQTADVMALDFGFVPKGDEKAVADAVVRNMHEKSEGFMNCGIFGLPRLGSMLARNGNAKAAWNLFAKQGENSFQWMLQEAETTSLWETLPINKLSKKVGEVVSHSHPMQAGYDVFFYEDIAGIRPDSIGYGFKVIRFEPLLTNYLSWAKASVESSFGTIRSNWKKKANGFNWQITIPVNTSGLVALPSGKQVFVNGVELNENKYNRAGISSGRTLYRFPSGKYDIRIGKN